MNTLRPYQQEIFDEILNKIKIYDSICVQAATGSGKTVIFTELSKHLNDYVLILVDRKELVSQTFDTFKRIGLDVGTFESKNKNLPKNKIIVSMGQTLYNRVNKNKNLLDNFKYCIIDEAHIWTNNKIFPFLKDCKRIGFTATPVRLKRYKVDEEHTEVETMSDYYDDIICSKPISWLMENGYLIKEKNEYIDFDSTGLKVDASGEFTASSLKEVFQSESYKNALRKTFDNLCDGKKTMIFTSSTETNAIYAELFSDKNIKTYDSVNNFSSERDSVVEWFRNNKDGVLINTGCFTAGFDLSDVEVILMARATKSLALWIQIAGRGARPTKKIEKPYFTLIDGGNNNQEHGEFSFDRDWRKIFFDKQRKSFLIENVDCDVCGFIFPKKDKKCPNCGWEIPIEETETEKEQKEFVINGKKSTPQIPTLDINFHIEKGHTKFETFKILKAKWVTFLCKFEIPKNTFLHHERKGNFQKKFNSLLFPLYLKVLRSLLKDGKHVKFDTFCDKIITETKIKKYEI